MYHKGLPWELMFNLLVCRTVYLRLKYAMAADAILWLTWKITALGSSNRYLAPYWHPGLRLHVFVWMCVYKICWVTAKYRQPQEMFLERWKKGEVWMFCLGSAQNYTIKTSISFPKSNLTIWLTSMFAQTDTHTVQERGEFGMQSWSKPRRCNSNLSSLNKRELFGK